MSTKSKDQLAKEEMADDFVIPAKYAMSMTMFSMASGGKNAITASQLKNLAMMPLQMFLLPQINQKIAAAVADIRRDKDAPAGIADLMDKTGKKFVQSAVNSIDKVIEPLMSIIDLNDSGTISKKEFFQVAKIAEILKTAASQGPSGVDKAGVAKDLLDAVFDLLDTNGDAAIQKTEIAQYIKRIFEAVGKTMRVVAGILCDILSQDIFDDFTKIFFTWSSQVGVKEGKVPPIFDDEGAISYKLIAPFVQMGDTMLDGVMQQAKSQMTPANLAMMKTYLAVEKAMLDELSSKADASGYVSKADYLACVQKALGEMSNMMKTQFTAILSGLPPQAQPIAMMVSGFIDPPTIFKNAMTSQPLWYADLVDAIFENFGKGGKLSTKCFSTIYKLYAGFVDDRVSAADSAPESRVKAVFDMVDLNKDGSISSSEAGNLCGALVRTMLVMFGGVLSFYLKLLSEPALITGGLAAAESLGVQFGAPMLQMMGIAAPSFPIKKAYLEGIIAKLLGGPGGATNDPNVSEDDMMRAVFKWCDVDGDGLLTFDEFNRPEPGRVGAGQFKLLCDLCGTASDKLDYDTFIMQYQNGVSITKDYQKAMSS